MEKRTAQEKEKYQPSYETTILTEVSGRAAARRAWRCGLVWGGRGFQLGGFQLGECCFKSPGGGGVLSGLELCSSDRPLGQEGVSETVVCIRVLVWEERPVLAHVATGGTQCVLKGPWIRPLASVDAGSVQPEAPGQPPAGLAPPGAPPQSPLPALSPRSALRGPTWPTR